MEHSVGNRTTSKTAQAVGKKAAKQKEDALDGADLAVEVDGGGEEGGDGRVGVCGGVEEEGLCAAGGGGFAESHVCEDVLSEGRHAG